MSILLIKFCCCLIRDVWCVEEQRRGDFVPLPFFPLPFPWSLVSRPKAIWACGFEKTKGTRNEGWVKVLEKGRGGSAEWRLESRKALLAFQSSFLFVLLPAQPGVGNWQFLSQIFLEGYWVTGCCDWFPTPHWNLKHLSQALALQSWCLERQHIIYS